MAVALMLFKAEFTITRRDRTCKHDRNLKKATTKCKSIRRETQRFQVEFASGLKYQQ